MERIGLREVILFSGIPDISLIQEMYAGTRLAVLASLVWIAHPCNRSMHTASLRFAGTLRVSIWRTELELSDGQG